MFEVPAVGMAVDHGAVKFQLAHAAFELVGRGLGILHGEMSEAGIAVRTFRNFTRKKIIRLARLLAGPLAVWFRLYAGTCDGDHAPLHARLVHRKQARL